MLLLKSRASHNPLPCERQDQVPGVGRCRAYASYYTSFPAVAIVVYFLRTRHGYQSLPEAIHERCEGLFQGETRQAAAQ